MAEQKIHPVPGQRQADKPDTLERPLRPLKRSLRTVSTNRRSRAIRTNGPLRRRSST
jgi:hypothetical protein